MTEKILPDIIKMYLKHFNLNQSPFAEEPDPHIFFPDAERARILNDLKKDLQSAIPLIRLTGSEGSGKTMLCRLLLRDLPADNYEVIYIDNPVGSFQDILHALCLDLGMEPATDPDTDLLAELQTLLDQNREQQKKVILLVDEADKLFLAALERLLRTICEVNETPVFQVVLAGRPELEDSLKQLEAYCSDIDIESNYILEPLTEEEVGRYLNFRLTAVGLPADTDKEVFSSGAVHKVFESARGNLRLVNILAEEALQASSADKSFLVLLDHVVEQDVHSLGGSPGGGIAIPPPRSLNKTWLAGGAFAILLLAVFLFTRGGDDKQPIADNSSQPEQSAPLTAAVPDIIEIIPDDASEIVLTEPDTLPPEVLPEPPEEIDPPGDLTTQEEPLDTVAGQTTHLPTMADPAPYPLHTDREIQPEAPEFTPAEPVKNEETVVVADAELVELEPVQLKTVPEATVGETAESPEEPVEVSEVTKTRPDDYNESEPVTSDLTDELNAASELAAPANPAEEQDITVEEIAEPDPAAAEPPAPTRLEKEQLYQQLLNRGERWHTGIHQDQFTIQMIALTSQDAIPNLKSMLFREEYQAIRDQLYILRKPTAPPTIYVFYGIYDSMDQARNARNNMPLFLRKHHPYALSIVNALKKTEY